MSIIALPLLKTCGLPDVARCMDTSPQPSNSYSSYVLLYLLPSISFKYAFTFPSLTINDARIRLIDKKYLFCWVLTKVHSVKQFKLFCICTQAGNHLQPLTTNRPQICAVRFVHSLLLPSSSFFCCLPCLPLFTWYIILSCTISIVILLDYDEMNNFYIKNGWLFKYCIGIAWETGMIP